MPIDTSFEEPMDQSDNDPPARPKLSAEGFIERLSADPQKAREIHQALEKSTASLIKKLLRKMFGAYEDDEVGEILNQTLLIVYQNFSRNKFMNFSDPPDSLQSYFWCIAENNCKTFQRNKYKSLKTESISEENKDGGVRQFQSSTLNPEEELIRNEQEAIRSRCRNQALDRLKNDDPDDYYLLISYTYDEGKTPQEMKKHRENLAEEQGINQNTLAIKITRIRKKLRENYQKCIAILGLNTSN